jgi:hypothetical protein
VKPSPSSSVPVSSEGSVAGSVSMEGSTAGSTIAVPLSPQANNIETNEII